MRSRDGWQSNHKVSGDIQFLGKGRTPRVPTPESCDALMQGLRARLEA